MLPICTRFVLLFRRYKSSVFRGGVHPQDSFCATLLPSHACNFFKMYFFGYLLYIFLKFYKKGFVMGSPPTKKKGSKNKVPYELKKVMRDDLSPKAVSRLRRIIEDPDSGGTVLTKALELVLAYGHGKPQSQQLVGIEAGPQLSKLMVRFMSPNENVKDVKAANAKVIEHLDPDNPKCESYRAFRP